MLFRSTTMADILACTETDMKMMLSAKVHLGTKSVDPNMRRYMWTRKKDGVHIINLGKTWEKLMLAARIIVAIENPNDVVAVSARPYGQRAVFKFAQCTGSNYIGGRYTPGTFTNQMQKRFLEPRLLIVTDPLVDHQPVKEAAYVNIPVIAFCDADAPLRNIDVAIPCNNKSKKAVALMWWMLAREILRMRGTLPRDQPWNTMVDLFMYREPEDVAKEQAAKAAAAAGVAEEKEAEAPTEDAYEDAGAAPAEKVADWAAESAQAAAPAAAVAAGGFEAPANATNF